MVGHVRRRWTFDEFWWACAMSRMDTRDTQAYVWTRGVHQLSHSMPPEEVTTFNLVRRLALRRHAAGGWAIALHSRPLEGGRTRSGWVASGADLELAVEVAPGRWIDLALQAKKFNPATGRYDGWSPRQNQLLASWTQANARRAAGMLLYNSSNPPFVRPGYAADMFRLCCSDTGCHGWRWPPLWQPSPNGWSPLAISLVLDINDPRVAKLRNPTPDRIADLVLPWECLFCPTAHRQTLQPAIGERPAWIEPIAETHGDEAISMERRPRDASYSLVLEMSDTERDEYDQDFSGT
jgi:hypothetical protein